MYKFQKMIKMLELATDNAWLFSNDRQLIDLEMNFSLKLLYQMIS